MVDKSQKALIVIGGALLIVAILTTFFGSTIGHEGKKPIDMRLLLEQLDKRASDEGLIYTFILEHPISDESDEDRLSIGYGYKDIDNSMYSIGIDHFCTRQIAGGAERIQCIPYTSVALIFYTNN